MSSSSVAAPGKAVDPVSSTADTATESKPSYPLESQIRDDESEGSSFSFDTDVTPSSLDDSPLMRAQDAVTLLMELGPSLAHPTPHDRFELYAHPGAAQHDINHVRASFPKADNSLIERLGTANWERRQSLRNVREALEKNPYRVQGKDLDEPILDSLKVDRSDSAVATGDEDIASSDSNSDVSIDSESSNREKLLSSGGSRSGSRTLTVTTHAPSDFQFSLNDTHSTAITEPTKNNAESDQADSEDPGHYHIPRPPSPNENLTGKPFVCPFCSRKILDIKSVSEWKYVNGITIP